MRQVVLATALTVPLAMPAFAQADLPETAPAGNASLAHSALKATTFKVGSTITNLTLLSYAAGGFAGGVALTTFMLGSSWLVYTVNDYVWETYAPAETHGEDATFDAGADVWRNTGKFLTYKPIVASMKLAALFYYTGSPAITATFGTASILTNTVVFYANNMAWDFYDWSSGAPPVGHH